MIETIISATAYFFVFLLFSFAFLLLCGGGRVTMKVAEFVIFITGCAGLYLDVYDAGVKMEEAKTNFYKAQTEAYIHYAQPLLNENVYNINPVRSEYSPTNYDDIVKDDSLRHRWLIQNKDYILACCRALEKINWDSLNYPVCLSGETIFMEDDSMRIGMVKEYNAHIDSIMSCDYRMAEYARAREDVKREISLWLLFSAALFFAKWTLEFAELIQDTRLVVWLRRKLRR